VYAVLEQYGGYVLFGIYLVGVGVLFFRHYLPYRKAYLQRFPPVNGVPLEMYVGGDTFGFSPEARAIWRALLHRQPDPELERMRRKVWRCYGGVVLWGFGFPVLAIGVAALVLTGFPH
jgi:hypothetical protein